MSNYNGDSYFIFIKDQMRVGGIQRYIIELLRKLIKNNYKIIWITSKENLIIDSGFKDDLINEKVEIIQVDFQDFFWIEKLNLSFKKEDKIKSIGFFFTDYIYLERIKRKYGNNYFKNIYWVAHYKEIGYASIFKYLKKIINYYIGLKIKLLDENNNIFYNNISHLKSFESIYNYKVLNPNKKIYLKSPNKEFIPFKKELVKAKYKNKNFNILTISRFDFPHKGYILGLIDSYIKLKKKYKNLKLFIIGYGKDGNQVLEKIKNIPTEIRKDIYLIGKVEYDKLNEYFEKTSLYIGLAGTIRDAALSSVISIPVRHYSYECEGYGFLPESKEFIISDKKGKPIEKYIEEVLNLSEEDYIRSSRASYDTFEVDPNYEDPALDLEAKNSEKIISNGFILIFRILKQLRIFVNNKRKIINAK